MSILFSFVTNWMKSFLFDGFDPFTSREVKHIFRKFIDQKYHTFVNPKDLQDTDPNLMGRMFLGYLQFMIFDLYSKKYQNDESEDGNKVETKAFYEFCGVDGKNVDINRAKTNCHRDFTDVLMLFDSTRKTIKYIEEKE